MILAYFGNKYHQLFLEDYLREEPGYPPPAIEYISLVGPRYVVLKRLFFSAWRARKSRAKIFIPLSSAFIYQLAFLITGSSAILYSDGIADLLDDRPVLYRAVLRINIAVKFASINSLDQYLSLLARSQPCFIQETLPSGLCKPFVLFNLKAPGHLGQRERTQVLVDSLFLAKAYALKQGLPLLISVHKSAFDCISRKDVSDICSPVQYALSYSPIYSHLPSRLCCAFITLASGAAADAMALGSGYPIILLDPGCKFSSIIYNKRNEAYLDVLMSSGDKRLGISRLR